jgi:hypothetical protein
VALAIEGGGMRGTILADYQSVPLGALGTPTSGVPAAVFSIRPLAGSPAVSRLATDGRLLRAAFEAGRAATHAAFAPSLP